MRLKTTDAKLSKEEHGVTRDGSLDGTRDIDETSNDDLEKPVRDGSLDSRREIAAKQGGKKAISNPRDGSLDRTRNATSKKVEPKRSRTTSGPLDDPRGVPETAREGSLDNVRGRRQTTREGSLDATRSAARMKTRKS